MSAAPARSVHPVAVFPSILSGKLQLAFAPQESHGGSMTTKQKNRTAAAPSEQARTPSNPPGLRDLPFPLPKVTSDDRKRAAKLMKSLAERYPDARCALTYSSPHELLIATILSAQTTDVNVNKAAPALFKRFPTPRDYADASPAEIEPFITSLGFFRNKARAIHESMRDVVHVFGGVVPRTMDELLTLRGVARKTANVVLGNAFEKNDGFVVDTHIERLSKRFGLAPEDASVTMVERRLCALFPRESWMTLSHLFIAHGRAVCKARGGACAEDSICRQFCSNAAGAHTTTSTPPAAKAKERRGATPTRALPNQRSKSPRSRTKPARARRSSGRG